MKVLINYADHRFYQIQQYGIKQALKVGGFDHIISYSPKDVDKTFFKANEEILKQTRGNGYWLWKPYFIHKTLQQLSDGDFLFYCDSDSYFIHPVNPIFQLIIAKDQDIIPFKLFPQYKYIEKEWTKRDAFILMNCDTSDYYDTQQSIAGYSAWRKSALSVKFANEWLCLCQDQRLITDMPNQIGKPNYPNFRTHRHDQSIFSLLSKKYHLTSYPSPSQWTGEYREVYPSFDYDQIIRCISKGTLPSLLYRMEALLPQYKWLSILKRTIIHIIKAVIRRKHEGATF